MATTYKKTLKSIVIKTLGGQTVNAADTASKPIASNALSQFEAHETMTIDGDNPVKVPFHAVDTITITVSQSDSITRNDPYCVEAQETGETGETGQTGETGETGQTGETGETA